MSLPPRAFFSLMETSVRWGCTLADIAGWAATDHLTLVTSIASVTCGKQPLAGIVVVSAADMMRMFRRHGPSEEECRVFRVRQRGSADWLYISEPAAGIVVKLTDLMLMADDVQTFEEDRDLLRRPFNSPGSSGRYDWDAVNIMLFRRINDQGLPRTQAELISEVQDWFAQHSPSGEIPEESTTRKKIAPIWRALREPA